MQNPVQSVTDPIITYVIDNAGQNVPVCFELNPADLVRTYGPAREVHPETMTFKQTGHRVLVVLDIMPEAYGAIQLPDAYKGREVMGAGVVIMCGAEVGYGPLPFPGGVSCHPTDLLGKHVVFGSNAGRPLRLDFIKSEQYIGELLVLADRDIWGPDWAGPRVVDGVYEPEENANLLDISDAAGPGYGGARTDEEIESAKLELIEGGVPDSD